MTKGYWIVRMDTSDPETYKKYATENAAAFKKYNAHFLVRGGKSQAVEGSSRARNVVIQFPSMQSALDCWNSPEYKKALAIRHGISTGEIVIVEGYEGPQPT